MKFLHLSDLHLGKKVNDYSMIEDQEFVLQQILSLENEFSAILISGDIFDKSIPNTQALELFGEFLDSLNKLNKSIFIISGNHDNPQRLSYLNPLLKKSNIFISDSFEGKIQSINHYDNYCIHLLPYLHPFLLKNYYPKLNYNDAFGEIIKTIKIDKSKINILLSHQFVGSNNTILSESEQKSVGGVDCLNYKLFKKFDYVALGHLHCPQKVVLDKIRYAGSILKYSFSEVNQKKVFTIFEFDNNKNLKLNYKEIKFKHDLVQYKGYIEQFLDKNFYSNINVNNYIHFILKDDNLFDAKKTLSTIYPNIMILEFDNNFTKQKSSVLCKNFKKEKKLIEHFFDFYKSQMNVDIDSKKKKIVLNLDGFGGQNAPD